MSPYLVGYDRVAKCCPFSASWAGSLLQLLHSIQKTKEGVDFSEPLPGRTEVGVGSFETVRMSMLLIMGFPRLRASLFFFLKHIHFLSGPEPHCSDYVNPPVVTLLPRASRELLVLGKSCQFERSSRMCPVLFGPGAKQILPGELKALDSWGAWGRDDLGARKQSVDSRSPLALWPPDL